MLFLPIKKFFNFVENIKIISNSKNLIIILASYSFIGSLFETIGLLSLFPIITALTSYELLTNIINNYIQIDFDQYKKNYIILILCLISLFLFLFKFIVVVSINYILNSKSYEILLETRKNLLNSIINLNYTDFLKIDESQIINSILNTTHEFIELTFRPFIKVISEGLLVILLFSILIVLYFYESIFILIVFSLFFILYNFVIKNKIKYFGKLSDESNKLYIEYLKYNIRGKEELNILNLKDKFSHLSNFHLNNFIQSKKKSIFFEILPRSILELIIFILIIFLVIINLLINNNTNLLLNLSLMALISLRLLPSINILVISFVQMRFSNYHFNKLKNLLNKYENIDIISNQNYSEKLIEKLELKNISFSYNSSAIILKDINFTISKNKTIGIFGESGVGKTTLIKIILGILKPNHGQILINNKEEKINAYIKNFFYLRQENFLLNDTIKNNITLFENRDFHKNEDKISDILIDLKLIKHKNDFHQFINQNLGDNGLKISGGQRQRIILARAIYFNKKFIILDEPTSSLDFENTNNMIKVFNNLKKLSTLIIVTHDENLIESCDEKFELKNKNIIKLS